MVGQDSLPTMWILKLSSFQCFTTAFTTQFREPGLIPGLFNIVRIFEYFEDTQTQDLLLVQEFLAGGTLLDRVKQRGRLDVDGRADIDR